MTGILCIDKEEHITSFGVVAKVRGITKEKKAGHAGTLDPMATGVLPILMGGATRFLELLPDHDKGYRAQFQLGLTTDTLDSTGTVLTRSAVTVGKAEVEAALTPFRGEIFQVPPMYSAVSQNGVRLYDLARQGIEVERKARRVTVSGLALTGGEEALHSYEIEVTCSQGTYIRSLIDDLGKVLGCGAVMTGLRRTRAAGFSLSQCVTLTELQRRKDEGQGFDDLLIPLQQALAVYPGVTVTGAQAKRFCNGGALSLERMGGQEVGSGYTRVLSPDGRFLGLGEADVEAKELKVKRLLIRTD